ncbi:ceramide transfer protein isoform X2 [Leptidea sinapis]|uniref:ceramide transfer protein isoform X2 n=1 Tax=Leptidea sinapis TaxID=189913 RepID=UPI0021386EC6|nr:ceramide transfer protein isoform X2 [Leptidea sinapis]
MKFKIFRRASRPRQSEEGPHSTLPDDEFYDAVETGFDKMEEERCARVCSPAEVTRDEVELPPRAIDNRLTVHPLWPEIDRISTEQIQAAFEGVGGEIGWQLFAEEGDMRMYRREMEVDGMVTDPLKAMHKVRGVSAREMCHYFFNPRYRYEWETTLETMTIVDAVSSDTIVFHQTFKRIWPASQRDALFWSHVRAAPQHTYAVTNHSTTDAQYPANTGACIRLFVTVCLACRSTYPENEAPTRDNITTSIAYCSTVNPGGWAPAGVLRAVYKREYPKFLKRFTNYVVEQCRDKPLVI